MEEASVVVLDSERLKNSYDSSSESCTMVILKHCSDDPDDRVSVVGLNMKSSGDIAPSMKNKKWSLVLASYH